MFGYIMEEIKFDDFDLQKVGIDLTLSGLILTSTDQNYAVMLPDQSLIGNLKVMHISVDDFKKFVKQMDTQETSITAINGSKIIVRKTQRILDSTVTWEVFERDNYTCRYCGRRGIPMSYDHVKLWEELGENTVENGVTACKKCNKARGNTDFAEWLSSDYVKERMENVPTRLMGMNIALLDVYKAFPNRISNRSR